MFDHLGWTKASEKIRLALGRAFAESIFTYDLARLADGAKEVKLSEFARAVWDRLN